MYQLYTHILLTALHAIVIHHTLMLTESANEVIMRDDEQLVLSSNDVNFCSVFRRCCAVSLHEVQPLKGPALPYMVSGVTNLPFRV